MSEGHAVWDCASDLLLSFSRSSLVQGEQLQVHPGLLALSSVCGLVTGVLTAALLLRFCVRPVLLTRQGYSIRRLLEPEDVDLENSPNEGVSSAKNEVPRASNKDNPEKKPPLVSGDVAAFATRAKVVYPINQKYRPLADGSSNPSLHEVTQVPPFSADRPSPSSSSCFEEDSEEEDEDCEGHNGDGRFVSSALPPSLKNHSFTPVSTCALTLTLTGVESRMNLYFLALRDVQQNYVQLQEEKDLVYFQIMKILFGARFPKNKQESDFCKMILQNQEKELSELKKQFPVSAYAAEETEGAVVTLEEIERSQKELLEHGLHTSLAPIPFPFPWRESSHPAPQSICAEEHLVWGTTPATKSDTLAGHWGGWGFALWVFVHSRIHSLTHMIACCIWCSLVGFVFLFKEGCI